MQPRGGTSGTYRSRRGETSRGDEFLVELAFLGGALQGESRRLPTGDHLAHQVEVARPDFTLVNGRGVAFCLAGEPERSQKL